MIYLDHAATSPLCDEARAAMEPYLTERFGNASEPHAAGRAAREGLQAARATIASLLGCAPAQVVFTSGGSEADNQAVFGLTGRPLGRIVVSAIEHPAVREPARELERQGFEVAWVGVDASGVVDLDAFDQAGFAVAAGSACASGESEPSHVLLAQGLTPDQARSVIRVSIGIDTTEAEVDGFTAAVGECVERLRAGALL